MRHSHFVASSTPVHDVTDVTWLRGRRQPEMASFTTSLMPLTMLLLLLAWSSAGTGNWFTDVWCHCSPILCCWRYQFTARRASEITNAFRPCVVAWLLSVSWRFEQLEFLSAPSAVHARLTFTQFRLSVINFCKLDISKLIQWIFAKFIADTPYDLPWKKWLTFGAHHVRGGWVRMAQNFQFLFGGSDAL